MDDLFSRLLAEADQYERDIRRAQKPGAPAHHLPNIRNAWRMQVQILVKRWIAENKGRGRAARVRRLEAQIGRDPRWTQLLERMRAAGAIGPEK
jgi:hypothetical protein